MKYGLLHIYCGDGKGKTTAATGLAVRMAGTGNKVLFGRFLKNENSGELRILDAIPEIEVLHLNKSFGFFYTLSDDQKEEMKQMYRNLWNEIVRKIEEGTYDMLVMDEFIAAYQLEVIDRQEVLKFLKNRPKNLEVVLTGRDPAPELLELADYVSEINKVKHPFDNGISARKGIEF